MMNILMRLIKKTLAVLVRIGIVSLISFVLLNVLWSAPMVGFQYHTCTDRGDLTVWIMWGLIGIVPLSPCIGFAEALIKLRLSWRRVGIGVVVVAAAVVTICVAGYLAAVLTHAEQGPCAIKWTFVKPASMRSHLA